MMATSISVDRTELARWQEAALVAAFELLRPEELRAVLGQLAGGARCVALAERVLGLAPAERTRWLAERSQALSMADPGPGTHPSWVREALERLDHRLRSDDLGPRMHDPGVDGDRARWYARAAFASLVPVGQTPDRDTRDTVRRLLHVPVARLVSGLHAFGLERLAWTFLHRQRSAVEHLLERMPDRDAEALVAHLWRIHSRRETQDQGSRRWALACVEGLDFAHDALASTRLAARTLAPHIEASGADLARKLAQRLPIEIGIAVQRELFSRFSRYPSTMVPGPGAFFRTLRGLA